MAARVISQHEGAAVIYGEKGLGKTTIMRRLVSEMTNLPDKFHIATIEAGEHCPTPFQLVQEVIEGSRFGVRRPEPSLFNRNLFSRKVVESVAIAF